MTGTSGPGIALKSEAMNLAVMVELPLVVIDVQRAGPSTGMPTKTEQADLLQVLYGRNGDSPIRGRRPADSVRMLRSGLRGRPPGDQVHDPGRLPVRCLPGHRSRAVAPAATSTPCRTSRSPNRTERTGFHPYDRDPVTLARPWAVPGTPGLEHRIGGLEKADITGNVSYDPDNHHRMQTASSGQDRRDRRRHPGARGLRARPGRPADPRLGLHLRLDPERGRTAPGRRPVGRPRPPSPPQPVPGQHRVGPLAAIAGC